MVLIFNKKCSISFAFASHRVWFFVGLQSPDLVKGEKLEKDEKKNLQNLNAGKMTSQKLEERPAEFSIKVTGTYSIKVITVLITSFKTPFFK